MGMKSIDTRLQKITPRGEWDSLDRYLLDVSQCGDKLTSEEEIELITRIKQWDNIAREKFIKSNLRFVISVAKQYDSPWVRLQDLIDEWNIWLIKAVDRFDETRWFRFISYAVWWIRQRILQYKAEMRFIQYPANRSNGKIGRFEQKFMQEYWRMPRIDEVCDGCDIDEDAYKQYLSVTSNSKAQSLDQPFNDDSEHSLYDTIGDKSTPAPDHNIIQETEKSGIIQVLEHRMDDKATYTGALACALLYWLNPKWINPENKEHTYEEISEILKNKYNIDRDATSIRVTISKVRNSLKKILTPNGQILEEYKRKFEEKHSIDLQIYNILWNTPEKKITRALNQLIDKKWTATQAKVLSLRYWIHSKFNPDWKKYTIEEIAWQLNRGEGSIKTTLNLAVEKFINLLQNTPSQPEILSEQWNNNHTKPWNITHASNTKRNITEKKIVTEPRDSSDIDYRTPYVKEALKIFYNQKTKKEEDQCKAFSLYSWLNDDWIAYSGKSFTDKLERSYPQSAFTTLKTAEKKIAGILGIDLSKMKEILENLNTSNRSAIRNTLSNISEQSVTKQIDTSDVDYRRKQIHEALPQLKEKRLLGPKKWMHRIKHDKSEVFRLYTWINSDGSVWEIHNQKEISEIMEITYAYVPKLLTSAKKDIADILKIKLDDLEKILENIRKSYSKDIIDVLKKPENNT